MLARDLAKDLQREPLGGRVYSNESFVVFDDFI